MKIKARIQSLKKLFTPIIDGFPLKGSKPETVPETKSVLADDWGMEAFPGLTPGLSAKSIDEALLAKVQANPDVDVANLIVSTQANEESPDSGATLDTEGYRVGAVYLCRYTSNNAVYGWTVRTTSGWSRIFPSFTTAASTAKLTPKDLHTSLTLNTDSRVTPYFNFELIDGQQ